jgi:hypothetical protein
MLHERSFLLHGHSFSFVLQGVCPEVLSGYDFLAEKYGLADASFLATPISDPESLGVIFSRQDKAIHLREGVDLSGGYWLYERGKFLEGRLVTLEELYAQFPEEDKD